MRRALPRARVLVLAGLGTLAAASPSARADDAQTINAFSVWTAQGELHETGENAAVFLGSLTGPMYIETTEGPVSAGSITCPGKLEINLADASQRGQGNCTLTAENGDRVFADWTCTGYYLIGCKGDFTLVGGTGRFAGITGKGPVTLRSQLHQLAKSGVNGVIQQNSTGIVFWRNFHYSIPAKSAAAQ